MRAQKVRINVSVYFAAFVACLLASDTTGLAAFALLCAAVHEAGHLAAISAARVPVRQIDFQIFGAGIRLAGGAAPGYGQEMLISLAGPAASFFMAAFCLWLGVLFPGNPRPAEIAALSFLLGAFNLLPACPLDGGRALEAFFCQRIGPQTAEKVMNFITAAVILPVAAVGFFLVLRTRFNFTLVIAAVYLAAVLVCRRGRFRPRECKGP